MSAADFASLRARLAAPALPRPKCSRARQALAALAREAAGRGAGAPGGRRWRRLGRFLQRAMACAIALEGELAIFHVEPAGAMAPACLDPASALHAFRPDIAVLVPHWRDVLGPLPLDADAARLAQLHEHAVRQHEALWSALEARGCRVVQHLVAPPARHWRGRRSAARRRPSHGAWRPSTWRWSNAVRGGWCRWSWTGWRSRSASQPGRRSATTMRGGWCATRASCRTTCRGSAAPGVR